jgi:hypothetical protein
MFRIVEIHVCRQLIGQAAHLAPAHGIGLAGKGKRTHTGATDASRQEMAVDDAVDLVCARGGLVDTL